MLGLGLGLGTASMLGAVVGIEAPPAALVFGAATRPGEGAVPIVAADGTYGAFTVSFGTIVPNGALTPGSYDVDGVSVTVVADARTVATAAELTAITSGTVTPAAGETIYLRDGAYDMQSASWTGHPSNVTFTAADPLTWPRVSRWSWANAPTIANVTLAHFEISRAPNIVPDNFWGPSSSFAAALIGTGGNNTALSGVTLENMVFDGQMATVAEGGTLAAEVIVANFARPGISDVTFRGNTVRNMSSALVMGCDGFAVEGNTFSRLHADGVILQNAGAHCQDGVILNNHLTEMAGNPSNFHSDFVQLQPSNNAFAIRRIQVRGNTVTPGAAVPFAQVDPSATQTPRTLAAGATTLSAADHADELRTNPANGETLTVTLPPATANEGVQLLLRRSTTTTGTVSVVFDGADTWEGGTPSLTIGGDGATFVSDGTSVWKRLPPGYRSWQLPRRASKTLGALEDGRVTFVDASDGDVTLTLPASGAATFDIERLDGSANTVTIVAGGGDSLFLHAGPQPSVSLEQGQGVTLTRTGDGNWTGKEAGPTLQGIFGNPHPQGLYEDITIDGNIILAASPHGVKLEQEVAGMRVFNNTFLRPIYDDANGDGVIGPFEGNQPFGLGNINMRGGDARSWANVTMGSLILENGGSDKGSIALNITGADPAAYLQGQAHFTPLTAMPNSRAEVIALAQPAPGGPLDGTTIGAVGYYDFALGAPLPGLPGPQIANSLPATGTAFGIDGALQVTFDQFITLGTGNVTLRNVTDGVDTEVFDVATGLGAGGGTVTAEADTVTITPGANLIDGKVYALRMEAGAVVGHYGTDQAAITDDSTLSFTADASLITSFVRTALDGTAQVRRLGASLNGGVTYNAFTFGFRGQIASGGSYFKNLFAINQTTDTVIRTNNAGQFFVSMTNLGQASFVNDIPTDVDVEILLTFDNAQPTVQQGIVLYVNGSRIDPAEMTSTSWGQGTMYAHNNAEVYVLGSPHADRELPGAVDFAWFHSGMALDLTDPAVRAAFAPGAMGADGSGPLGSQPEIYMTGDATSWNAGTNLGSLIGFTAQGTF